MLPFRLFVVAFPLLAFNSTPARAVVNGNFETGDLTGWTSFTYNGGVLEPPGSGVFGVTLMPFPPDTFAVQFQVGSAAFPGPPGGGGIFQNVSVAEEKAVRVSADIAAWDSMGPFSNADWGRFQLLVDGNVVDSHAFGQPPCCNPVHASLSARVRVTAGSHEIRVRVTRGFTAGTSAGATPYQYIDNVTVADVVPSLGALGVVALGLSLLCIGSTVQQVQRRRCRAAPR